MLMVADHVCSLAVDLFHCDGRAQGYGGITGDINT